MTQEKCACGHDIIAGKEIGHKRMRREYYHFYVDENFYNVKCFDCKCKNPVPKHPQENNRARTEAKK